jgi:glycerophosphoryl diester phosphodiesterase
MQRLVSIGVDGLITDRPDLARAVVAGRPGRQPTM